MTGEEWLREWVDRDHEPGVLLPESESSWRTFDGVEAAAPQPGTVRTYTKRRCAGLAPYVGQPFRYVWNVATDDRGHEVTGTVRIQRYEDWWRRG